MGDGVAAVVVVDVKGEGRVVVDNMDYIIAVIVVVMADGAAVVDVMADGWCVVKLCKILLCNAQNQFLIIWWEDTQWVGKLVFLKWVIFSLFQTNITIFTPS